MKKNLIILLLILLFVAGCAEQKDKYSFDSEKIVDENEFNSYVISPASDKAKGKSVKFGAEVFNVVDVDDGYSYYQIYSDPINHDGIVMLLVDKNEDNFKERDIIQVEGVIVGEYSGENLMGGKISSLAVRADNAQKSTFSEAIAPSLKTIEVNQKQTQNDFDIEIERIEFSEFETRLYLNATNNSKNKVSLYSFDVKVIASGKNYTEEGNFTADYPEIDSELSPNTSTEGIISYKPIEFDGLSNIEVIIEAPYSDDWEVKFEDYTFSIEL